MIRTLRSRLVVIFLAATLAPLGITLWMATNLLERSLSYSATRELDTLSRSLETTGRELYQSTKENLLADAASGRARPKTFAPDSFNRDMKEFWQSDEAQRFILAGHRGDRLDLLRRRGSGIDVYSKPLDLSMGEMSEQFRAARAMVAADRTLNLRRGFNATMVAATGVIWLVSLLVLIYLALRLSKPIRHLTAGLSQLAGGNFAVRLGRTRDDEIGEATEAFNETAAQLEQSRDRLVYLTQLASWQVLAKKTAHEVKNSLTPIRLTVEEMVARSADPSRESHKAFLEQAAQIVIDEIESLERRVRAFSDFSSEPPVSAMALDINSVVEERIAFLRTSHPEIEYAVRLAERAPTAMADADLVKGILLNLLENAAEAAGEGGLVLAWTEVADNRVVIEVHDSGPGLSDLARKTLFQPTISFKKRGMGMGLSIARKSALLTGGDIVLVTGELGGAGFRVMLPVAVGGLNT